ncbi:MAG: alpha/beta fold hydrolase [Proteobacteria bacterium]|nr:alpha/beta fold hydrolase [Pseudomonadota bacterium]MDA1057051.1 alpha/beta fold hydrolase [Pseudomonadota bacterium]
MGDTTIRSHFLTVGTRRVHYRRAGSGPPVVMLHASPSWARAIDPFTRVFAERFTAIALDSPGYGHSDLLDMVQPEIPDFAEALKDTLDALGIDKCAIWGSHTGASIAMEFTVRYPERVSVFVIDGYPAYEDAYRADMTKYYLPPYEPKWDASHLLNTWHKFREQFIFSPTFRWHRENRSSTAAPPLADLMQDMVLPRFITGEAYNIGYSAVFRYAGLVPIGKLAVPTCFGARTGDSLIKGFPLIETRKAEGSWTEELPRDIRQAALRYREILEMHPAPGDAPPAPVPVSVAGKLNRSYVDLDFGQMAVSAAGPEDGIPLVLLPQLPGDVTLDAGFMLELAKLGRRVIALDMPGNGDSDDWAAAPSIAGYAAVLLQALDKLGLAKVDLLGHQGGASVATEFVLNHRNRVRNLLLFAPLSMPDEVRLALAPHYAPPIEPKGDGSHLISLWFALRNEQLFWPWYNESIEAIRRIEPEIDPKLLSRKITGILKHYRNYHKVWQAVFDYPVRDRLQMIQVRTLVASIEDDPFHRFAPEAAAMVPDGDFQMVDFQNDAIAKAVDAFLVGGS